MNDDLRAQARGLVQEQVDKYEGYVKAANENESEGYAVALRETLSHWRYLLALLQPEDVEPWLVLPEHAWRTGFRAGWWRRGKESALGTSLERRNALEDTDCPSYTSPPS